MNIKNHKRVQKKARGHTVERLGAWKFRVTSGTSGQTYYVYYRDADKKSSCSCEWGAHKWLDVRSCCSHAQEVFRYVELEKGRSSVSAWANEDEADRQHRPAWDGGDGTWLTSRK